MGSFAQSAGRLCLLNEVQVHRGKVMIEILGAAPDNSPLSQHQPNH